MGKISTTTPLFHHIGVSIGVSILPYLIITVIMTFNTINTCNTITGPITTLSKLRFDTITEFWQLNNSGIQIGRKYLPCMPRIVLEILGV